MNRILVFVSCCFLPMPLLAQLTEREKIQQLEMQKEFEKNRRVKMQIDSGVYYMEQEEYEVADEKFRFAFNNLNSIPSDLAYYFGKNSYYMGKYKQSVDWLSKYIQLKGTSGQFSSEAAGWLRKAEQALVEEHKTQSITAAQVLSRDYTIDCGPAGRVTCPVCTGSTVIVKKDYLHGEIYKTCPYCNKQGWLSCADYNLLIRGQLKASPDKAEK